MTSPDEDETLGWDTDDRDARIVSGELTEDVDVPTEVLVAEDE